jgi:hypothetical protein
VATKPKAEPIKLWLVKIDDAKGKKGPVSKVSVKAMLLQALRSLGKGFRPE